ncbi:uncharacterized protein LOC144702484 [Wolffia australiana]
MAIVGRRPHGKSPVVEYTPRATPTRGRGRGRGGAPRQYPLREELPDEQGAYFRAMTARMERMECMFANQWTSEHGADVGPAAQGRPRSPSWVARQGPQGRLIHDLNDDYEGFDHNSDDAPPQGCLIREPAQEPQDIRAWDMQHLRDDPARRYDADRPANGGFPVNRTLEREREWLGKYIRVFSRSSASSFAISRSRSVGRFQESDTRGACTRSFCSLSVKLNFGMGDYRALNVDDEETKDVEPVPIVEIPESSKSTNRDVTNDQVVVITVDEEEPLIHAVECRICQEEDSIKNLDIPCACCGSLKYAHKTCLQRWINEKGDLTCEICHEPYKPGYVSPPPSSPDEAAIDIDVSSGWPFSAAHLNLDNQRLLAMAAAQRHFLEAEQDEAARNASGASFCRSAALILMGLLLLRHALTITNDNDDDASDAFSLFLLRAAGFLLPCYIMAWTVSILQRRRQAQEAAELAAAEVAFILQSGQMRGLQFAIDPEPPLSPQEPPRM